VSLLLQMLLPSAADISSRNLRPDRTAVAPLPLLQHTHFRGVSDSGDGI